MVHLKDDLNPDPRSQSTKSTKCICVMKFHQTKLSAGGKPSTWFPPGKLAGQSQRVDEQRVGKPTSQRVTKHVMCHRNFTYICCLWMNKTAN